MQSVLFISPPNTMKKLLILIFSLFCSIGLFGAKPSPMFKFETAYLSFFNTLVNVDPGPGWKGHNLNNEQNALAFDAAFGLGLFSGRLFVGAGAAYQNFEGYHAAVFYGDADIVPLKTRLSPVAGFRIGYHQLWNQYEGGTSTAYGELGGGVAYRLNEKIGLYAKTGVVLTQQSSLIPLRFGLRYKL